MKLRTEAKSVLIPVPDAPKIIVAKIKELYDSIK
jgi:hypothetical protein